MDTTQPTATQEPEAPPSAPTSAETSLRDAMLQAIGELSEADRERLAAAEEPADVANAWRDLIAEQAAQEREDTVRAELTREFEAQTLAARQLPTAGLHGGPPPALPTTVAEWTDYIRSSDGQSLIQQRRAQFAEWLAKHPEA